MSNLNPDRLLKCWGDDCVIHSKKHPAKTLRPLTNNAKKVYCPECHALKTKEAHDRKRLEDDICSYFGLRSIAESPMILGQIKNLHKNYSLKNMRLALDYYVRIRGQRLNPQYGIAIIKSVHNDMISYYKELQRRKEQVQVVDTSVVRIKMKPPERKFDYKQSKMINMEALANEIAQS